MESLSANTRFFALHQGSPPQPPTLVFFVVSFRTLHAGMRGMPLDKQGTYKRHFMLSSPTRSKLRWLRQMHRAAAGRQLHACLSGPLQQQA